MSVHLRALLITLLAALALPAIADVVRIPADDLTPISQRPVNQSSVQHQVSADAEVLLVSLTVCASAPVTATWGGNPMTVIQESEVGCGIGQGTVTFAYDVCDDDGSTKTLAWNTTGYIEGFNVHAVSYKGLDMSASLTSAFGSTSDNVGTAGTSATVTGLTGGAAGDMISGFASIYGPANLPVCSGNDQTEINNSLDLDGTGHQSCLGEKLWGSGANNNFLVTWPSSNWHGVQAVVLKAGIGCGGPGPGPNLIIKRRRGR